MKNSGAPENGDLVKVRQGLGYPDYTDWSNYQGVYLVVGERGVEVQLLGLPGFIPPVWIRRDLLEILKPA